MRPLTYLALLAALFGGFTYGYAKADIRINTMLWSTHHIGKGYNESHGGVGLSYHRDDQIYSFMHYKNSFGDSSNMYSIGKPMWKLLGADIAIHAAVVTGYSYSPAIAPVLTASYGYLTIYHVPLTVTAIGFSFGID